MPQKPKGSVWMQGAVRTALCFAHLPVKRRCTTSGTVVGPQGKWLVHIVRLVGGGGGFAPKLQVTCSLLCFPLPFLPVILTLSCVFFLALLRSQSIPIVGKFLYICRNKLFLWNNSNMGLWPCFSAEEQRNSIINSSLESVVSSNANSILNSSSSLQPNMNSSDLDLDMLKPTRPNSL